MKRRGFVSSVLASVTGTGGALKYMSQSNAVLAVTIEDSGDMDVTIDGENGNVDSLTITLPDDGSFSLLGQNITDRDSDINITFEIDIENEEELIENVTLGEGAFTISESDPSFTTLEELETALSSGSYVLDEEGLEFSILDALDQEGENTEVFNESENGETKETTVTYRIFANHIDADEISDELIFTVSVTNS